MSIQQIIHKLRYLNCTYYACLKMVDRNVSRYLMIHYKPKYIFCRYGPRESWFWIWMLGEDQLHFFCEVFCFYTYYLWRSAQRRCYPIFVSLAQLSSHSVLTPQTRYRIAHTKVRLLKEFSKVAMTNPCRGKFNRVTIFLC